MELDEMQKQWAVQDKKLDEVLRLNRKLLESQRFSRARSTLQRLRAGLGIELLLNAVAVAALGAFIGNHFGELRFLLPAVALDIAAVAILASSVRQFLLARTLDFTGPVTGSQRSLEALRVVRIHTTQRVLLASPLAWTPLLVVALQALFGVDAYTTLGTPYLAANLFFGVAFVLLMRWAARRWADRLERGGWARRWAEALAGTSLTAARDQLASIADFERENELRAATA
jgi:hypothetical protein